jgi:hypothetical protein
MLPTLQSHTKQVQYIPAKRRPADAHLFLVIRALLSTAHCTHTPLHPYISFPLHLQNTGGAMKVHNAKSSSYVEP